MPVTGVMASAPGLAVGFGNVSEAEPQPGASGLGPPAIGPERAADTRARG